MNKCEQALDCPKPVQSAAVKTIFVVAAALIDPDNRILIAQRPEGKPAPHLWEFPGGKVEQGEIPEFALMRELEEELGIETRPTCFTPLSFASHTYDDFHLMMPLYVCRMWRGAPKPITHQALKWARVGDLTDYDMPEADYPLIPVLRDYLG